MSKNSNTEVEGFFPEFFFVVVLIAHTVSGDSSFEFVKNWLFRETLATIIFCTYNLYGSMSITSDEIVDAMSERKKIYTPNMVYMVLLSHLQSTQQMYSDTHIKSMGGRNG